MKPVSVKSAPAPAGHYSQAIIHGGVIYVSGQLPIDPTTGHKHVGSIEKQTEQAIANVESILNGAGSSLSHVLKTTIYISDIALWDRVNAVYARLFGAHRPARAVVPTKELHFGFQIEIEAIAALKNDHDLA